MCIVRLMLEEDTIIVCHTVCVCLSVCVFRYNATKTNSIYRLLATFVQNENAPTDNGVHTPTHTLAPIGDLLAYVLITPAEGGALDSCEIPRNEPQVFLYDSTSKENPGKCIMEIESLKNEGITTSLQPTTRIFPVYCKPYDLILICQVPRQAMGLMITKIICLVKESCLLLVLLVANTRKRSGQFCTCPIGICTHSVAAIQLLQQKIRSLAVVCYVT